MGRRTRIVAAAAGAACVATLAWGYVPIGQPAALHCAPHEMRACGSAFGRILYVQRSDGRGSNEMHLVLASPQSVTWPGISVIVIKGAKRPHSPPHFGDWITVVGLPTTGSHGEGTLTARQFHIG